MSITVTMLPLYLLFNLGTAIGAGVVAINAYRETNNNLNKSFHIDEETLNQICTKVYKTNITNEATLIKTLQEHNSTGIIKNKNYIECNCSGFHLEFLKPSDNEPYNLEISYDKTRNPDGLVENIGTEYLTNAQEASYNKIVENLEEQNLNIDEEEIYDDNTIVLTVNLE